MVEYSHTIQVHFSLSQWIMNQSKGRDMVLQISITTPTNNHRSFIWTTESNRHHSSYSRKYSNHIQAMAVPYSG